MRYFSLRSHSSGDATEAVGTPGPSLLQIVFTACKKTLNCTGKFRALNVKYDVTICCCYSSRWSWHIKADVTTHTNSTLNEPKYDERLKRRARPSKQSLKRRISNRDNFSNNNKAKHQAPKKNKKKEVFILWMVVDLNNIQFLKQKIKVKLNKININHRKIIRKC